MTDTPTGTQPEGQQQEAPDTPEVGSDFLDDILGPDTPEGPEMSQVVPQPADPAQDDPGESAPDPQGENGTPQDQQESVNWEKRYKDAQRELTKQQQDNKDFREWIRGQMSKSKQQERQGAFKERVLDTVGQEPLPPDENTVGEYMRLHGIDDERIASQKLWTDYEQKHQQWAGYKSQATLQFHHDELQNGQNAKLYERYGAQRLRDDMVRMVQDPSTNWTEIAMLARFGRESLERLASRAARASDKRSGKRKDGLPQMGGETRGQQKPPGVEPLQTGGVKVVGDDAYFNEILEQINNKRSPLF